ncbi:MAG: flavodoxin [Acidimicrobiia bacterium]
MHALVVFESMFGNTEEIARAAAAGLAASVEVEICEVGKAPALIGPDVGLLVVGGPTHAFGLSRPGTRKSAAEQTSGPLISQGPGLREWLATLQFTSKPMPVATFDTRIDKPRLPGSAARAAEKRLRRIGAEIVTPSESFFVDGTTGPLLVGEKERAVLWGAELGRRMKIAPAAIADV